MKVIGDAAGSVAGILFIVALWLAGSAAYFAPTIIALVRKSRDIGIVIAVNLFLGWTLVGWVVALAFSMRDKGAPLQQPWPQMPPPYPYPYPPQQQNWPAQRPMWHTNAEPPQPYPTPQYGPQQTFPYGAPDDQLAERRRRHMR